MKKLSAFLLTLTMILATACAKKSGSGSSGTEGGTAQTVSVVQTSYKESQISFGDIAAITVSLQKYDNGYCYFYEDRQLELKMVRLDSSFKASEPISLGRSISMGYGITVHDDGSFTILSPVTDFELEYDEYGNISNYGEFAINGSVSFVLTEYDGSGSVVSQTDVPGLEEDFNMRRCKISDMTPLDDGKYIVSMVSSAAVIDENGNVLESQIYDQTLAYFGKDSEGKIIFTTPSNFSYINEDDILAPPSETDNFADFNNYSTGAKSGSMGFKAFFRRDDGIYGFTDSNELILVVDFKSSIIEASSVSDFICCGEGQFLTAGYDSDSLKLYTRRPDDYTDNRQTVNVWQIYGGQSDEDAVEFNKQNDDYLVKYAVDLKSLDDLSKAVLTGESPDLIFYTNRSVLDGMINLGAAADLYTMMESYDGVKPDDLMPNVVEAFDMDGKLYAIPDNFCVSFCYANSDYIGDEYRDWTFEDMYELYDNRPQGMSFVVQSYDALENFLIMNYQSPWIDSEKMTCNFNNDRFIKLLEFCKNTENPTYLENGSYTAEYIEKKLTCMKDMKAMLNTDSRARYGLEEIATSLGETGLTLDNTTILSMPDSGGTGTITCDNCYTVLNTGKCPDGAWAFVSYLLSDEKQLKTASYASGFNWTNKKAFEAALQNTITDGDKPEIKKVSYSSDNNTFTYEYPVTVTAEQADKYRDLVLNSKRLEYNNDDVRSILSDEYYRYANDEITAEECASYIQDRVSILLSEQS